MRKNNIILLILCFVIFTSELRAQQIQPHQRFESAYKEILSMLEGKSTLSIKRSVFLAEWAYLDGNLDFEQDFCVPLTKGAQYMRRLITANWTEDTEELEKRWSMSEEEINKIKNNIKYVK